MNEVEEFIKEQGWDEVKVMNYLQDQGMVISDLCVMAADIGNGEEAIKFLWDNKDDSFFPNLE